MVIRSKRSGLTCTHLLRSCFVSPHSYLKTEANDEAENFLREFTLNKAWQADVVEANPDLIFADIADEVAVENANAFESAYNFRFEEEGGGQIKTHARTIEDSMRRKDDKRKRQREARYVYCIEWYYFAVAGTLGCLPPRQSRVRGA